MSSLGLAEPETGRWLGFFGLFVHALGCLAMEALCDSLGCLVSAMARVETAIDRRRIHGPGVESNVQMRTRRTWRVDHIALGEG